MRALTRLAAALIALVGFAAGAQPVPAGRIVNPDEITVYFPAFHGDETLGRNVATVLSLQLAQTTRRAPWPDNPLGHDFGPGMIRWSRATLEAPTHDAATRAAAASDLLAQVVVWGSAHHYGADVVADVNVTLPRYAPPGRCGDGAEPCDYRTLNFERWTIDHGVGPLTVEPPSRAFSVAAIPLAPAIVAAFREAAGLPIHDARSGGRVIGRTGESLRFQEFNRGLPGAPTRLSSGGVTGWVRLPELHAAGRASEFAEMVGGLVQTMRGDWDGAARNFARVVDNPATRPPLRLDALLLLGMAETRGGGSGRARFERALAQAPYDRRVVRYAVMDRLASGVAADAGYVLELLAEKRRLFASDDPWLKTARATARRVLPR